MAALFPYFIAFLAISMYATLGPLAKKIGLDFPPFALIAASSLILFICATPLSFFFEKRTMQEYKDLPWPGLLLFSLTNLFAYFLFLYANKRIPIVHYDMFGLLMPIIGGLLAVYLLGEPFHSRYLVGLAIVAVGIFVAVKPFS